MKNIFFIIFLLQGISVVCSYSVKTEQNKNLLNKSNSYFACLAYYEEIVFKRPLSEKEKKLYCGDNLDIPNRTELSVDDQKNHCINPFLQNNYQDNIPMPIYGDDIPQQSSNNNQNPVVQNSNEIKDDPLAKLVKDAYPHFFTKKSDVSTANIIPVLKLSPNSAFHKFTGFNNSSK